MTIRDRLKRVRERMQIFKSEPTNVGERKVGHTDQIVLDPQSGMWHYRIFPNGSEGKVSEFNFELTSNCRSKIRKVPHFIVFLERGSNIYEVEDSQMRTWVVDEGGLKDLKDRGLV